LPEQPAEPRNRAPDRGLGLSAIKRSSVALEAVDQIKEMIINGQFEAGQKLPTERELAEMLGVSRPTIRESIRALVALRIVEPVHGAGTYVSSLKPELLAEPIDFLLQVNDAALGDLFDARLVLEAGLAGFAAQRRLQENLDRLDDIVRHHASLIDDYAAAVELDFAFHEEIARAAHSPILASLLSSIAALGRASRARTGRDRTVRIQAHSDHEAIIEAVREQNRQAAQHAMAEHLAHIRHAMAATNP
jgi:GntR family transcriptional regulator, transcriptional repressor for pyruvate dehydrogenase complex